MSIHSIRFNPPSIVFQSCDIKDRLRCAVAKGDENSVLDLMKEPEFSKISPKVVETNLYSASMSDHLGIVLALIKTKQFNDISANSLEDILEAISLKGCQRIVSAFIECERFGDIDADRLGKI